MFDFGDAERIEWPITRRGVEYMLVAENEYATICRGSLFDCVFYEVFEKRVNRARTIAGVDIPAKEAFPGDEAFGKWARCVKTLEAAHFWARELADRVIERSLTR